MLPRIIKEAFPFDQPEHVYHMSHGPVMCIFLVSNALKTVLDKYFIDFEIEHSFIELYKQQQTDDPSVLAHWTKEGLILMAMKEGLQLANYYPVKSAEDAIYYVLSAYHTIEEDPLKLPLSICGRIAKDSQYYQKLSGFVRDFQWKGDQEHVPANFDFQSHLFYHLH